MSLPRDPHEIDLAVLFPSLPEDRRKEMRDFLDGYCEIALQVLERLERERNSRIDTLQADFYSEGKVDSPKQI
jgi:ribosome recycling factor